MFLSFVKFCSVLCISAVASMSQIIQLLLIEAKEAVFSTYLSISVIVCHSAVLHFCSPTTTTTRHSTTSRPQDPAASSTSEAETDPKGESVALNYKPSPLQVQIEKQRDLARKASVKNGTVGSPVNQQPKKNARTRLVVPNKGYSSLDQSPDEKPLVALDTDSDDDFDMSRYSSSGYSSAEVRCLRDQVCVHLWM
uniref:Family with sequence similarity 219 member Aa n=1 Tax=Oryzias sinensis TaxID=183150 RepID=A0A8C7X901_9TELE